MEKANDEFSKTLDGDFDFGFMQFVAQTTAFSYQGRLSEAGNPVTGTRFFRFTLFDENGTAIPGAIVDQTLTVTSAFSTRPSILARARFREQIVLIHITGDVSQIVIVRTTRVTAPRPEIMARERSFPFYAADDRSIGNKRNNFAEI